MSVVIPVESVGHLPLVFAGLPAADEVIVVVGRDEDTVLRLPRAARVIRQTRTGTGNAVACGVAAATKDVVVTLPGDGSADPGAVPRCIEALRAGADVAEGYRLPRRLDLILLWFMSVLFGVRPSGPGCGLRAFRRDRAGRLGLPRVAGTDPARGDGSDGEPLLAVRSRTAGLRVAEVPVAAPVGFGGTPLHTALRALAREHLARRRESRTPPAESIVIMTGGSGPVPDPIRTGPAFWGGSAPVGTPAASVNLPRRPIAGLVQGPPRWPAPNPATVRETGPANSAGIGFAATGSPGHPWHDRRHFERRSPQRRRTDITPDRRSAVSRPAAEALNRRRWRDGRNDADLNRPRSLGRPNLRVINGEGGGTGGGRGHLRSV